MPSTGADTVSPLKQAARALLPAGARQALLRWQQRLTTWPPRGGVRFGSLRRTTPVSRKFAFGRGQSVDRYYMDRFLERHAQDIRGEVLEIGEATYTKRFGGERVVRSHVLHAVEGNPEATIVADLARGDGIASEQFDAIVCLQTLHYIYDIHAAVRTLHRLLKPGGVLLATVPGISQLSRYDSDRWGEYWRLTSQGARRLFADGFPGGEVAVEARGNVLAAVAFLHGIAAQELRPEEVEARDPDFEVSVLIRAVKGRG